MSLYHLLGAYEPERADCAVSYWMEAVAGADSCMVFVHGFGGSALATWSGFPAYLSTEKLANTDIYFYGYDSFAAQANIHGEILREFLSQLMLTKKYGKALLIGHSLGAVVIRRALLNAWLGQEDWVERVSIMFFAPAHSGATDIIQLGLTTVETLPKLGKAILSVAGDLPGVGPVAQATGEALEAAGPFLSSYGRVSLCKSLRDLQQGSNTLEQLKADTLRVIESRPSAGFVTARKVVLAFGDDVVDATRFLNDPVGQVVHPGTLLDPRARYRPGFDHIEICKPGPTFMEPVEAVFEVVEALQLTSASASPPQQAELDLDKLCPLRETITVALRKLFETKSDGELRTLFRNHSLEENRPILNHEIHDRRNLDDLIELASLVVVARNAGLKTTKWNAEFEVWKTWLLLPSVAHYRKYYPMPLIEEFLSPPVSYPPVDSLAQLFQVFCSFHLRLHQPATQTFLDLLDDYYFIFASESFAIQDLWAIIQDPRKLNRALLVSHDSIGELAVHGYRRFLHFCLDFYELWKGKGREQDPAAAALVEMMRQHFQYWFLAFSNKDIVSEQLKNAKTLPDDLHEREEGARQIKEILAQLAGVENLPPPEEPDGVQRFLSKCWGWLVSTW